MENGFGAKLDNWSLSDLYSKIQNNKLLSATFAPDGSRIDAIDRDNIEHTVTIFPMDIERIEDILTKYDVPFDVSPGTNKNANFVTGLFQVLFWTGFISILGGRFANGQSNNIMDMIAPVSQIVVEPVTNVTFADVAGCDESKIELSEVVDFLKDPEKYTLLGAQIPRGILMEGPPGTGKTLMARAIAGEAGVPFIQASGSEFVEVFVGLGANRIRTLFREAKENAPCIFFIDEIDAIGQKRSSGTQPGGANDEREQTLNQILTEMDGFEVNKGVIVLAATNRGEALDDALLRPGRFDRRVPIPLPSKSGRFDILKVHARDKKLDARVDLGEIASRTIGFSGASLRNLMNEAAIVTARRSGNYTTCDDIDVALERILVGIQLELPKDENRKKIVAVHEAGHALMAALTPDYDNVTKVTIIPRTNGAGGLTLFTPTEERISGLYTFRYLNAQLAVALGGRVAEELVFGIDEVTTGASSDLQQVRDLAQRMIKQWGYRSDVNNSSHIAPIAWETARAQQVYGRENSVNVENQLDIEMNALVQAAYDECKMVLCSNQLILQKLAQALIDKESLTGSQVQTVIDECV